MRLLTSLCLFILLSFTAESVYAGTKGKIAGKVTDSSGEVLVGVQVFIEGTTRGTTTDVDGKYSLVNLDPGEYTVVFTYIGFATVKVQKVEVLVDKTTSIDAEMSEEVIEGEEIIVTAERPIVEKDRTTTTSYVSAAQLEDLPLVSINEAINQQAGVVDGHFRGGRTGEVSYLVNGVPINNAFNNGASFDVEQNMVSSLEVISGVFNAEYGQAMSGVVNIVTKGVSREWSGNFLGYAGRIVSNRKLDYITRNTDNNIFLSRDDFSNDIYTYSEVAPAIGDQDYQVSLGGPIIKDKLGIQTTLRYVTFDGHLIGRDLFRPSDIQSASISSGADPSTWLLMSSGDGEFESLNRQKRISLNSSIVYEINSKLKIDYNLFFQTGDGRNYSHFYKYNPSAINPYYFFNQTHILGLRYSISNNAFANLSYSYLDDRSENYLYDDVSATGDLDERYVASRMSSQQGQYAFAMGGNDLGSGQDITKSHTIVADFTSQVNNTILWKSGITARFHELDNEGFGISVNEATQRAFRADDPFTNNSLEVKPYELAAYSQVKLELEDLIVNAGLRVDYFEPDFVVPIDLTQYHLDTILDPATGSMISNRKTADPTYQVSPRLGVAFPISEQGVMRFSAGLFF